MTTSYTQINSRMSSIIDVKRDITTGRTMDVYSDGNEVAKDFIPPFAGTARNFRSMGATLVESILETIDNSSTAGSTETVIVATPDPEHLRLLGWAVVDNGKGMKCKEMLDAFVIGTLKVGGRAAGDIGKFHTGLKSATIATGSKVVIMTRTAGDSVISGLVADIDQMSLRNKYEPTFWSKDITEAWVEEHNIPAVLHKMLLASSKGTVVYVTNLLPKFKRNVVDVIAELRLQVPLQYSGESKQSIFTQCGDAVRESLEKESLFYENEADKLQDRTNFSVQVYKEENEDNASYHVRMWVSAPFWGAKKATEKATPDNRIELEFTALPKSGKFTWKKVTKKSKVLTGPPMTIEINSILLKETTHMLEKQKYTERLPARAHYHFRRGERGVGSAFTAFAGVKIQDRTHVLLDRFRVLTTFSPSLDDEFGVKHTKQMEDKALPCKEIAHAILTIGRASFNQFTKDHHDGERSSVVSSFAGGGRDAVVDEDDDDESTTTPSTITGGDSHSVSTEVDDLPPLPEMPAAPPVVDHKSTANRILSRILGRIIGEDVSQDTAKRVVDMLEQIEATLLH